MYLLKQQYAVVYNLKYDLCGADHVLKKCQGKLDCLIHKILFIRA